MGKKEMKVIELFAGVGGFRLGLEGYKGKSSVSNYEKKIKSDIIYRVAYSNQFEPSTKSQHASKIYEKRFLQNMNFISSSLYIFLFIRSVFIGFGLLSYIILALSLFFKLYVLHASLCFCL